MISYDDALGIIRNLRPSEVVVSLPLSECFDHILAEDLVALVPSPPFTNSAMDGFAIVHAESANTGLKILGTAYASVAQTSLGSSRAVGTCVRIMTGAPLPLWADTVVPVEYATVDGEHVSFASLPPSGSNIRVKGDDLAAGAPVLKAGRRLDAERLMVASAVGYATLRVHARPELQLFSTGDELVEPGTPLPPGGIYNSSKFFLLASARKLGFINVSHQTIPDREDEAAALVQSIIARGKPTVIVSTGAVSAGDADFIPRLSVRLGFTTLFHQVAIRPGKPVFLSQKADVFWLGLPGNAVSTCVGWQVFARPLLAALAGTPLPERRRVMLSNEVRKSETLRCFFRAELNKDKVWVAKRQGSADLAASAHSEAYVELPEGTARFAADSYVDAIIV